MTSFDIDPEKKKSPVSLKLPMPFTVIPKDQISYQMPLVYRVTDMTIANPTQPVTNHSDVPDSRPISWDSSADCHQVPYPFHVIVGIIMAFMAIFCTVGNILVLITFARHARLRTSSNIFIINLTVADLIMAVVDFPLFAVSSLKGCWILGYEGCQFYGMTSSVAGLVSINTLAAISFDRYVVVVRRVSPRHRMNKSTAGAIIGVIWILSVLWSILPVMGISTYRLEGMGTSCTFNYIERSFSYTVFFICLVIFNFFIPLLVIAFCYTRIFFMVHHIKREILLFQGGSTGAVRHRIIAQAEVKTAFLAVMIIAVFCLAWTPYVVIAFCGLFGDRHAITPVVSAFPNIFAKFSTASNSMLYSVGHPEIRKRVKGYLFLQAIQEYIRPTSATPGNCSSPNVSANNNIQMPRLL